MPKEIINSFVTLKYNNENKKSKTIENDVNPIYNDEYFYNLGKE